MKVRYDKEYDVAYIYIAGQVKYAGTYSIDFDIHLDLDPDGRLLGIEVLDATRRLDLTHPFLVTRDDKIPSGWPQLREELQRRMDVGLPVILGSKKDNARILDVGEDRVVLSSDSLPEKTLTVTAAELEPDACSSQTENDFVRALRILGQYPGAFS